MPRINCSLAFAILVLLALPSVSAGQADAAGSERRMPVTILVSDRIPSDSRFVVQRVPSAARRDRILLRSDATGEELMAAINALLSARQIEGDIPSVERTLRIRPTQASNARRAPYPWVARILTDLRQAAPTDVPGIGRTRAVQIWLPIQHRNGSARPNPRSQGALRQAM